MKKQDFQFSSKEWLMVMVIALGYFVDMYDFYLFSVVRKVSLLDLNVPESDLVSVGLEVSNAQLYGMMVGGILWGTLADKIGRKSILYGSIITYSLANMATATVTSTELYWFWRFITGIGLAGELGVGITLVSENLPKTKRTSATMIISAIGLLGIVVSALLSNKMDWRTSYVIGGVLGLMLLLIRYRVNESRIFKSVANSTISKGNILNIFRNGKMAYRYILLVLSGAPVLVFTMVFLQFSPEFAENLGVEGQISAATAIIYFFLAMTTADILAGFISKILHSRKKVLIIWSAFQFIAVAIFLFVPATSSIIFYIKCSLLGVGIGYWGVLITYCAETFGTNYRAVATTSMTNFIRGLGALGSILFKNIFPTLGYVTAGLIVATIFCVVGLVAIILTTDKFENDLNYINLEDPINDTDRGQTKVAETATEIS